MSQFGLPQFGYGIYLVVSSFLISTVILKGDYIILFVLIPIVSLIGFTFHLWKEELS